MRPVKARDRASDRTLRVRAGSAARESACQAHLTANASRVRADSEELRCSESERASKRFAFPRTMYFTDLTVYGKVTVTKSTFAGECGNKYSLRGLHHTRDLEHSPRAGER